MIPLFEAIKRVNITGLRTACAHALLMWHYSLFTWLSLSSTRPLVLDRLIHLGWSWINLGYPCTLNILMPITTKICVGLTGKFLSAPFVWQPLYRICSLTRPRSLLQFLLVFSGFTIKCTRCQHIGCDFYLCHCGLYRHNGNVDPPKIKPLVPID